MNYEYILQRIIELNGGIKGIHERILIESSKLQNINIKLLMEEDKEQHFNELLESFALIELCRDILIWHYKMDKADYINVFNQILNHEKEVIKEDETRN